CQQHNSSPWTF
nr:immunoglobulin light chain junction region [Macaca mulatta]MOX53792.1 immunoglobulin light chain junction region [Macaca mulatta]